MSKSRFPWILAGILVLSWAARGILGLVLAAVVVAASYYTSLRVHPRIRHWRCKGTGEHRGAVFTWVFRKCGGCSSGRVIRWGAGQWGSDAIKAEAARTDAALKAARSARRWR